MSANSRTGFRSCLATAARPSADTPGSTPSTHESNTCSVCAKPAPRSNTSRIGAGARRNAPLHRSTADDQSPCQVGVPAADPADDLSTTWSMVPRPTHRIPRRRSAPQRAPRTSRASSRSRRLTGADRHPRGPCSIPATTRLLRLLSTRDGTPPAVRRRRAPVTTSPAATRPPPADSRSASPEPPLGARRHPAISRARPSPIRGCRSSRRRSGRRRAPRAPRAARAPAWPGRPRPGSCSAGAS